MYLKTSDGSISNCSIQFNLANNGGGLYVKDGTGDFNITSSDIIGNEVSANAGGLYNKNSNVLVQDCSFTDNSSNKGGALYSYSSGDATISNTIFTDNSCLESGGAANIRSSSDVTFNQCTFDTNVADSDCDGVGGSGVIEMTSNCTVILDSPTICVNLVCDVIEDFSGIEPTINGEIQGCSSGLGACCGGVACWEMTHNDCLEGGGTYSGEDTACQMVECFGTDAGACCMIDICIMAASEGACIEAGGLLQGAMILCDDEEVSCPEGCPADLSGDGSVEVNDIIELISAWGACP